MAAKTVKMLDVRTRRKWRDWLRKHHESESEVWLVFHKQHTPVRSIDYEDAVEEALCFGWIDSLVRRLDEDRYARKFTPRKADSAWSTINRQRYARMKESGLLAAPGLARPPTERSGDAPRVSLSAIPEYIGKAFRAHGVWERFGQLAPSHRRNYIAWVDSAKREETKQRRLAEAIRLVAAGEKPGLK